MENQNENINVPIPRDPLERIKAEAGALKKANFLKKFTEALKQKIFLSEDRRREVYYEVDTNAVGGMEYYVLILLSCIIATLGLLNNSAAVIIGAMIVAPLMNPTMGTAMGVVRGDMVLFWRSLRTLILGVIISIAIACMAALLIPNILEMVNNSEVAARTLPNILDIAIALAAGAAGAFAISKKKIASSLAGVAIAVSLMPPLAVTGIGLAAIIKSMGSPDIIASPLFSTNLAQYVDTFTGSFALCFSNLVGINFSGIIVFQIFGFGEEHKDTTKQFMIHYIVSPLLVTIMAIILLGYYMESLEVRRTKANVQAVLTDQVRELDPLAEILGEPSVVTGFVHQGKMESILGMTPMKKLMWLLSRKKGRERLTIVKATIIAPSNPDELDRFFDYKVKALLEEKVGPVNLTLRFINTSNVVRK